MLVGIYDLKDDNGWDLAVIKKYEKILTYNGISFIQMDASKPEFWEKVTSLNLFIFRWSHFDSDHQKAHDILHVVDRELGIKCYPDWTTCWHYDDKVKQYMLMRAHGLPMVESYIFWEKTKALEWTEKANYPVVFKLRNGAGSNNIALVHSRTQAQKLVKRMFGKGIYPESMFSMNSLRIKQFNLYRELHQVAGNLYHP